MYISNHSFYKETSIF